MTDPRETLARIRKQADAATEGPWMGVCDSDGYLGRVIGPDGSGIAEDFRDDADAEFIAAARTTVPWLLEQVELRDEALNAVLKLHKPVQATTTNSNGGVSDITICDHCLDPTWPCPTVTAITTPLEGKSDD